MENKQGDELGSHDSRPSLDQGDSSGESGVVGLESACISKAKPAAGADELAGGRGGDDKRKCQG